MASVVKDDQAKSQEDDRDRSDERDEKENRQPAPSRAEEGGGFFHLYKPGQGYWTRMGTAIGAALVAALTAHFLYDQMPVWLGAAGMEITAAKRTTMFVIGGLIAAYALLVWYLI